MTVAVQRILDIDRQGHTIKEEQDQQEARVGHPVNFAEEAKTELIMQGMEALTRAHNEWLAAGQALESIANVNNHSVERDFGVMISLLRAKDAEIALLRNEIARRDTQNPQPGPSNQASTEEDAGNSLQSQNNSTPAGLVPGNSGLALSDEDRNIDPSILTMPAAP